MTETVPGPRVIEIVGSPAPKNDPAVEPRIIETDDTRPIEIAEPTAFTEPDVPTALKSGGSRSAGIACAGIGILVSGLLAIDAFNWISAEFERSIFLGWLAFIVVVAGMSGLCYWLTTEMLSLKRLRSVERHRTELEVMDAFPLPETEQRIADILEAIRPLGMEECIAKFRDAVQQHHSTAQRLELLSRIVLNPLDERARKAIRRATVSTMGMSAVIPSALADTVIFAARGIRLIKQIAEIYGHRPGAAGTLHLFKRLLIGTGTIGAADVAGNTIGGLVAQHLGSAAMEKVGEKMGTIAIESAIAGQRMARIGVFAMKACRPVEFRHGEEPSITKLVLG